jgi:hypothetical protein
MSRLIFLLGILTLAHHCLAQRVLYTSQDISQPYQGPAIRAIRPHWYYSPTLTIKYKDGRSQDVPRDSIWGYEDRRGRRYRYYKGTFYRVLDANGLVRYSIQRPTGRGVANMHYFSQGYDSPLRWTKAKARRESIGVR